MAPLPISFYRSIVLKFFVKAKTTRIPLIPTPGPPSSLPVVWYITNTSMLFVCLYSYSFFSKPRKSNTPILGLQINLLSGWRRSIVHGRWSIVFGAIFYLGFKPNPHVYFHADSANQSRFRGSSSLIIDLFLWRSQLFEGLACGGPCKQTSSRPMSWATGACAWDAWKAKPELQLQAKEISLDFLGTFFIKEKGTKHIYNTNHPGKPPNKQRNTTPFIKKKAIDISITLHKFA